MRIRRAATTQEICGYPELSDYLVMVSKILRILVNTPRNFEQSALSIVDFINLVAYITELSIKKKIHFHNSGHERIKEC